MMHVHRDRNHSTQPNTFGNFATVSNPNADAQIDTLVIRLLNPAAACCPNPTGLDNIVVMNGRVRTKVAPGIRLVVAVISATFHLAHGKEASEAAESLQPETGVFSDHPGRMSLAGLPAEEATMAVDDRSSDQPGQPARLPDGQPCASPRAPSPPCRLGDFEVIREIGKGGMGTVYEACQVSLNRKVALKVLSGGIGFNPVYSVAAGAVT